MVQEYGIIQKALEEMTLPQLVELMQPLPPDVLQKLFTACATSQAAKNLRAVVTIAQCPRACGSGITFKIDDSNDVLYLECENGHGPWKVTDLN